MKIKQRFRILEFTNASGTISYRVTGSRKSGERVRENYLDPKEAQCRQTQLESEHLTAPAEAALRTTRLSDAQIHLAEAAFRRLDDPADILRAIDNWLTSGKPEERGESPRIDEAVKQYSEWLESHGVRLRGKKRGQKLRDRTKKNLRLRVSIFANSIGNLRVDEIKPETIEKYLEKRGPSAESKDNDRRALSSFFTWCIERPRRWAIANPCKEVRVDGTTEDTPPAVLTVAECEKLLRTAEAHKDGRLAPYVAVCLFGGLRPGEAEGLTWEKVNLQDKEIRVEATSSKMGASRVVSISDTLLRWLKRYKGAEFYPSNWRRDFDVLKHAIGYNGANRTNKEKIPDSELKPWPEDVLRHTAISHYFRLTGSYGQTAEQFGNSEAIIKKHYQGRVTTAETKAFYKLLPKGKK